MTSIHPNLEIRCYGMACVNELAVMLKNDIADRKRRSRKPFRVGKIKKTNKMAEFYCKNCGYKASSVASLTSHTCSRHPLGPNKGKCELYEGSVKSKYTCKYCGYSASSISSLTSHTCSKHPNEANKGKCSPAM